MNYSAQWGAPMVLYWGATLDEVSFALNAGTSLSGVHQELCAKSDASAVLGTLSQSSEWGAGIYLRRLMELRNVEISASIPFYHTVCENYADYHLYFDL